MSKGDNLIGGLEAIIIAFENNKKNEKKIPYIFETIFNS
jgi:hypothetical protein